MYSSVVCVSDCSAFRSFQSVAVSVVSVVSFELCAPGWKEVLSVAVTSTTGNRAITVEICNRDYGLDKHLCRSDT